MAGTARAFVFPGQGSQTVGMGKDLADAYPAAAQVFEQVDAALGESLSSLIFEGPEDQLTLTANAQPALMAVSLAAMRAIEAESGKTIDELCDYVAGHSLGEYSALAAAGTLDIATAARLLRLRGQSMQKAVPVGEGAMAALIGADLETAEKIAEAARAGSDHDLVCDIANDNGGGQVVLSGSAAAIDRVLELAADHGVRRAVKLPVSAPFHCTLMAPAADAMAEALAATDLRAPLVPVIANVSAKPTDDRDVVRRQLVEQVTGRVRWRETVEGLGALGVTTVAEIGSGKVLSGLVKRIDKSVEAHAINTPADVAGFVAAL
ncbi:MAG: ACP S-malonyltransferase [Thalassobaculaceae bacterium]